jgi:hypothetical protein
MKRKIILACLLIAATALLVAGCSFNNNYLVKNARLGDVETGLKDYVGLSGYTITYSDDTTGAYRIVVDRALVATTPGQPESIYGAKHDHPVVERQVASLAVQMTQQDSDVFINAQSTGQLDASTQYNAFLDFLKGKGYTVQEVK